MKMTWVVILFLLAIPALACKDYSGDWVLKDDSQPGPVLSFRYRFVQTGCNRLEMADIHDDLTTTTFAVFDLPNTLESKGHDVNGTELSRTDYTYFNSDGFFVREFKEYKTRNSQPLLVNSRTQTWNMNAEQNLIRLETIDKSENLYARRILYVYKTR